MKGGQSMSERHNFTKIKGRDLEIGVGFKNYIEPLLYYKVLRTKELKRRTGYKHGIKSYRKFLNKYEKLGLIGTVSEDQFSEQYIYAKERLLRIYKNDLWKSYSVDSETIESIKLHWQVAKVKQYFTKKDAYFDKTYINEDGPYFEFSISTYDNGMQTFAFYTDYRGINEQNYFGNLHKKFKEAYSDVAIIFTQTFDIELLRELTKYYLSEKSRVELIGWCHMHTGLETKEQIKNAKVITLDDSFTLDEFINGGASKIINSRKKPEPQITPTPEPYQIGIWDSLKEVFR